jgi:hypothetical protein
VQGKSDAIQGAKQVKTQTIDKSLATCLPRDGAVDDASPASESPRSSDEQEIPLQENRRENPPGHVTHEIRGEVNMKSTAIQTENETPTDHESDEPEVSGNNNTPLQRDIKPQTCCTPTSKHVNKKDSAVQTEPVAIKTAKDIDLTTIGDGQIYQNANATNRTASQETGITSQEHGMPSANRLADLNALIEACSVLIGPPERVSASVQSTVEQKDTKPSTSIGD